MTPSAWYYEDQRATRYMTGTPLVCDLDTLKLTERTYRQRLLNEPADTSARVDLAWCLFMQALHRAGQESASRDHVPPCDHASVTVCGAAKADRDAIELLKDSLRQAYTVMHLSSRAEDQMNAKRLHMLVKLSGAVDMVSEAATEASKILDEITSDIIQSAVVEEPKGRLHRLPPRPQK
jgi:hypothetical protein